MKKYIYLWQNCDATKIRAFTNKKSFDRFVREVQRDARFLGQQDLVKEIKDEMNHMVQRIELE